MKKFYFIDTNILVKYYIEEEGTEQVRNLIHENEIHFSNWTILEFLDILRGRLFLQNLDKTEQFKRRKEFELFFQKFQSDIVEKIFYVHILPPNFHRRAKDLIYEFGVKRQMGMKRNDALQILAYEEFLKRQPETIFVTHDEPLKKILIELNLNFFDPVSIKSIE